MLISIITVCYNSALTIRDTFESVLHQTYSDIDYIVIDGSSNDGTLSIINEYENKFIDRMRWISESDNSLYDAMNKGIIMAKGNIVGFLNSDDIFYNENVIEKVIDSFKKNENVSALYANLYYVSYNDTSKIIRKWITGEQKQFKTGWHPPHPTLYIKKDVYNRYGLFKLEYKLASDFEIMLRFIEKYKIYIIYLNEFLIKMRIGGKTNKSIYNIILQNIEILKAFKNNKISVNYLIYPIKRSLNKILQFKK